MKISGKKILITGGAGFLGSHLCDNLINGNEIYCMDIMASGRDSNIKHLLKMKDFHFVEHDVLKQYETDTKFDMIFHFASRAAPDEYQKHPLHTLLTNSMGTHNILELARKHDSKILISSTSEVYGDAEVVPTPETYWGYVNTVGVRSCYDEGKRYAETLFYNYRQEYGMDAKIIRIFNTYGPRIRADGYYARALPKFIVQALENKKITVYGDGSQTRSFCYVDDLIAGTISIMESKYPGPFNLGNPDEITILELAKTIKELTNSKSDITFHPLPSDDPRRRCPDISKAKRLLNWEPKVKLRQGLEKTIDWFREKE
jgi:nucleoside-diphosphate-sugar epimerase